ncbi:MULTISPECIES: serine protease [unclassified Thiocapsa]|uniref:serine protease n=1 Tax=unclassified Thiocapsa TaxID=2641286 RepID=UPI0035B2598F
MRSILWSRRLPDPKPRDPGDGELDYALLRLASTVGEHPPRGAGGAEPRGWIPLRRDAVDFGNQSVVAILQHPETLPLKLALGFAQRIKTNEAGNRIRHTVPTQPGSFGSPLLDSDWRVVALHHSGDPKTIKPDYNEAIPIALIAAQPKVADALPEHED